MLALSLIQQIVTLLAFIFRIIPISTDNHGRVYSRSEATRAHHIKLYLSYKKNRISRENKQNCTTLQQQILCLSSFLLVCRRIVGETMSAAKHTYTTHYLLPLLLIYRSNAPLEQSLQFPIGLWLCFYAFMLSRKLNGPRIPEKPEKL